MVPFAVTIFGVIWCCLFCPTDTETIPEPEARITTYDETIKVNGEIFTLYDGQRHHVSDWDYFLLCGYDPLAAREVSEKDLADIPVGKPFLRCPTMAQPPNKDSVVKIEDKVYTLYWGQRHYISNWENFLLCGYNGLAIPSLSQDEVDAIPLGFPFLRCFSDADPVIGVASDGTLYVVRADGTRHLIPSRGAFQHLGYGEAAINVITQKDLEAIPLGDPISIPGTIRRLS